MCVKVHAPTHKGQRLPSWYLFSWCVSALFGIGSLADLKLTILSRLAGQWVPGSPPVSIPLAHWGFQNESLCLASAWYLQIWIHILRFAQQALWPLSHPFSPASFTFPECSHYRHSPLHLSVLVSFFVNSAQAMVIWKEAPQMRQMSSSHRPVVNPCGIVLDW